MLMTTCASVPTPAAVWTSRLLHLGTPNKFLNDDDELFSVIATE